MSEILFLSHRIPYPPDKGDKIRSYHMLRMLAEQHTVHLGTFIDDPHDWKHAEALGGIVAEACLRHLNPRLARLRSLRAIATGRALTLAYYHDRHLHRWVRDLAGRRRLDGVFVFSSSMGQYARCLPLSGAAVRIMDVCDVDSDKWRQYAARHNFPMRQIYAREARLLAASEAEYLEDFDACLVVSDAEATILQAKSPSSTARIRVVPNGVDAAHFDPSLAFMNPFDVQCLAIVFTGAMDYHANIDAVTWFARNVFPGIRCRVPEARFVVVGANPAARVRALGEDPGVIVTGRVPDVRPYLAHAAVVVAPLRIARGVQNKVLEALAMGRPVVATENAVQGIPCVSEAGVWIDSDPKCMEENVVRCIRNARAEPRGRDFVLNRYNWARHLEQVCSFFPQAGDT